MTEKTCCTPQGTGQSLPSQNVAAGNVTLPCTDIPGGRGMRGTDHPIIKIDGEGPCRAIKIKPFAMMTTTVTNAMFEDFVEDTGYETEAERLGWSFVFEHDVPKEKNTQTVANATWWHRIDGASWRLINGPGSEMAWIADHPVVQVSMADAVAFGKWAGGRLPTEEEWEHAARGGQGDVPYPWGEAHPNDTDHFPCNIWQGNFPQTNTGADGYLATAPAQSFAPNGYGLFNMCGNVWEWTATPYKVRSLSKAARAHAAQMRGRKVLKGGSFLCHASYCLRYRIAARTGTTPDTATTHQGFRLVFDSP